MTLPLSNPDLQKRWLRVLVLIAAISLFVLIVTGGIQRVNGTGGACPDWPTCFGSWAPPAGETGAIPDYLHRLATALVALPLGLAALIERRLTRHTGVQTRVRRPLSAALFLMLIQVVLGAALTLDQSLFAANTGAALHLGTSLLAQASLTIAAAAVYLDPATARQGGRSPSAAYCLTFRSPFARLSLVTLGTLFILLVSGGWVAASGAGAACTGWPLCEGGLIPLTPLAWIATIHRGIVALAALLVAVLFVQAWRTQRSQTAVLVATTAAFVLFFAQALLGAKLVAGFPGYLLILHEATAVAVWAAAVLQTVAVGFAGRTAEEERAEAAGMAGRTVGGMAKDLLLLTKPIVVLLLLVTTYAGMVIGAQAWPSLSLTFWTLLGGFLAAGGSGAINQYVDRYDDGKMQRTQKRPIPAGRLEAGEGLAFGVGIALASFYLVTAFVNFLSALLLLAGIIYYVILYSLLLKKTTVQNIVIGGGAGAIPPLVGWAAATGSLNFPSLFLFAVVFMWTPPHFWALALVRRKDYARAGVPMLPVIRGEAETQRQIFLYTLELVVLTLFLPLFGLGGAVYLIGAALLGAWLLSAAWRVKKEGGNKLAWKMYRYSSMYLAFLFLILMVDRLL